MKKFLASAGIAAAILVAGAAPAASAIPSGPETAISQSIVKAGHVGSHGTYVWWSPACWFWPMSNHHTCWI